MIHKEKFSQRDMNWKEFWVEDLGALTGSGDHHSSYAGKKHKTAEVWASCGSEGHDELLLCGKFIFLCIEGHDLKQTQM